MACPYAEKKGPIVICKVIGKKVNPLAFPCLTNKYQKCKYYKEAQAKKEKPVEKPTAKTVIREVKPEPLKTEVRVTREKAGTTPPPTTSREGSVEVKGEVKGITLDGRKPRNCLECIYYGSKTKTCLLLGITIEDPYDPPCAKTK